MAHNLINLGQYISTGNPATVNDASPVFLPGAVGGVVEKSSVAIAIPSQANGLVAGQFPRLWQYVKLDSGATAAYGACVVWLDYINLTVTTVSSNTKQNSVAGALCNASATPGNYVFILVSGVGPALMEAGQTPAAGDAVIGGATTAGRFGITAEGTAPASIPCGVVLGAKTIAFNGSSALPADTCAVMYNIRPFGLL